LPDGLVDLADRRTALVAGKEVTGHELELGRRPDAAADRRREALDQGPGDPRRAGTSEPGLGLAIVEEEVTRLVERDALHQVAEHGVLVHRPEPSISGQGRQLVD